MADKQTSDVELDDMRRTAGQDRVSEDGTQSTFLNNSRTATPTEQEKRSNQRIGGATSADQPSKSNDSGDSNKNNLRMSLENQYRTMANSYGKETVESMDFLAESKDRAQITANSALSLSLVVVLKELLDQDPGSKYHLVSLVLVSICLALQVTVGLLALYMYQLKAKLSVFRKRAQQTRQLVQIDPEGAVSSEEADMKRLGEVMSYRTADGQNGATGKDDNNSRKESLRRSGSVNVLPIATSSGLDKLNDTMIQMLTDLYADVLIDIQKIQIRLISATDDEEEMLSLQNELKKKDDVLKLVEAQLQIAELKGEMLSRREMLVKVTQIQNAITYLLYVTFIINAFLTGFGIS